MRAAAKEFAAALARVMPVLKTRSTLPILTYLKLEAKNGRVLISATDIDAHACAACPCEGELAPICVGADMLNYLAKQGSETIYLTVTPQERLAVITDDSSSAKLNTLPAAEFPPWPMGKWVALGLSTTDLAECIKGVCWAADDPLKGNIDLWRECVWVKTTSKSIECCATDTKEFAYVNKPLIGVPSEFMFPAKQASLLTDGLLTGGTISLSDTHVATGSDNFSVAIRLAEGRYAPVHSLLEQKRESLGIINGNILDALHTIKALGKEDGLLDVNFDFRSKDLTISFQGKQANFERSIPFTLESLPVKLYLDVMKAIRVLAHVRPGARAMLNERSLFFVDGDFILAVALIQK